MNVLARIAEEDRIPVDRAGFKPVGTRQACLVGSTPTLFRHYSPSLVLSPGN